MDEVVTGLVDCALGLESFLGFVFLEGGFPLLLQNRLFDVIVGMGKNVLIFGVFHKLEITFGAVILCNNRVNQGSVVFKGQLNVVVDVKLKVDFLSGNLVNLFFVVKFCKIGMLKDG